MLSVVESHPAARKGTARQDGAPGIRCLGRKTRKFLATADSGPDTKPVFPQGAKARPIRIPAGLTAGALRGPDGAVTI